MARSKQFGELCDAPVRIRDESGTRAGRSQFKVLPKHSGVRPAEIKLRCEFCLYEIRQRCARQSEQSKREKAVDLLDADLGRSSFLQCRLACARFCLAAMLHIRSCRIGKKTEN